MIKKIVITIGKSEVNLTLEETKKLYEDLKELFGDTNSIPYYTYSYTDSTCKCKGD